MKIKSGAILRALMENQGKSFNDVARYAGVDRSFIWQLATERRTTCRPVVAERVADLLAVPIEVLFDPKVSPARSRNSARQARVAA